MSEDQRTFRDKILDRAARPAKGRLESALVHGLLRLGQGPFIFETNKPAEPIHAPKEYAGLYPALKQFSLEKITTRDGVRIALWHKTPDNPADKDKPVYVVFHGRGGHWGDVGHAHGQAADRSRLAWLQTLADTGSEVIAVHMRGYGESRKHHPQPTVNGFKRDVEAVADYLERKDIQADRVSIMGGSLGGAAAIMLAKDMTVRKKHPPAVLGMIDSFTSIEDCVRSIFHFPPGRISGLRYPFNSVKEMQSLTPATALYIAHAPTDTVVPYAHQKILESAAHSRGMQVKSVALQGDYLLSDYAHGNWNPSKIIADMEQSYHEHKTHLMTHNSNGQNGHQR